MESGLEKPPISVQKVTCWSDVINLGLSDGAIQLALDKGGRREGTNGTAWASSCS
jgi:hypothetical protein